MFGNIEPGEILLHIGAVSQIKYIQRTYNFLKLQYMPTDINYDSRQYIKPYVILRVINLQSIVDFLHVLGFPPT